MAPSMRHPATKQNSSRRTGNPNKYKSHLSGYQHIQTISSELLEKYTDTTLDDENKSEEREEATDFVIKVSVQEEIQDQLEYESRLLQSDSPHKEENYDLISPSPILHRTFAEATMATRPRTRRRNDSKDDGIDMTLSGPMSLESLGPFKYTFKKKRNLKSTTKFPLMSSGVGIGSRGIGKRGEEREELDSDFGINDKMKIDFGEQKEKGTSEVGFGFPKMGGTSSPTMSTTQTKTPHQPQLSQLSHQQHHQQQYPLLHDLHTSLTSEFSFSSTPSQITQTLGENNQQRSTIFPPSFETLQNVVKDTNIQDRERFGEDSNYSSQVEQSIFNHTITTRSIDQTQLNQSNFNYLVEHPRFTQQSEFSSVSHSTTSNTSDSIRPVNSGVDLSTSAATSFGFLDSYDSDSQSVKDRSQAAMARLVGSTVHELILNDGFDSVQWDPDLPARSSADNSPEPLSVEPQPVAYTTVGSRVNPNAQPQIAAPNRIQREGSIRRPPLDHPMHNRQSNNYYSHQRGPPPPLSMQNSMHYAQQLSQGGSFNTPPSSARVRSARSAQRSLTQSEQETQALLRLQGMVNARPTGAFPVSPTPTPSNQQMLSFLGDDKDMGRCNDLGPIQGLEKMQTLQRLARFENPMQASALRRLSEFSTRNALESAALHHGRLEDLALQSLLLDKKDTLLSEDIKSAKDGELDRAYTFPPPGLSTTTCNPLYGAYGATTGQTKESTSIRVQLGYPQPLTAGPPGQRSHGSFKQNVAHIEDAWTSDQVTQYNIHGNTNPTSPWQASKAHKEYDTQTQVPILAPVLSSVKPASASATDSIPRSEAMKYYPNGFPSDMAGRWQYTRLSYDTQKEMGQIKAEEAAEKARVQKQKDMDDWFYAGQKRWNMTTEDHVKEIENRVNPFGPIGPPSKRLPPSDNRPLAGITVEEMNKKTIPEVITPMLDTTFGHLLALAAEAKDPSLAQRINQYTKSPEYHIDSSARGNDSYFGEDWGIPTNFNIRNSHY